MTAHYACLYGLGGSILDPAGGMATISQKCTALGLDGQLTPWQYTDAQAVSDWIKTLPKTDPLFLIGDSCGANRLTWIAASVFPRIVTGLYPIQASIYCKNSDNDDDEIWANVQNAIVIFSDWAHTGGLGVFVATPKAGNKTTNYQQKYVPAPHPDDQDVANVQDPIFASIKALLASS